MCIYIQILSEKYLVVLKLVCNHRAIDLSIYSEVSNFYFTDIEIKRFNFEGVEQFLIIIYMYNLYINIFVTSILYP